MRNKSLDIFRLIAAFAVILLHVNYGDLPFNMVCNFRLLGRFAVPFFFLVTGYFFYKNHQIKGDQYFPTTIKRLISIFIVASIIYIPIEPYFEDISLNYMLLIKGTSFHLWFISSMIFGLTVCWYNLSYLKMDQLFMLLSISILALILASEPYYFMFTFNRDFGFVMYLISIPFIFFGMYIAKENIQVSKLVSISMIALGIAMQHFEADFLFKSYQYDPYSHQFLIGTIPFALGMFFLSFECFNNPKVAHYAEKYSLAVYLYHVVIMRGAIEYIIAKFGSSAGFVLMFSPFIVFGGTLGLLILVDKYTPRIFQYLNGQIADAKH